MIVFISGAFLEKSKASPRSLSFLIFLLIDLTHFLLEFPNEFVNLSNSINLLLTEVLSLISAYCLFDNPIGVTLNMIFLFLLSGSICQFIGPLNSLKPL